MYRVVGLPRFICLLFSFACIAAQHKIIYLISPPRTLSTVFLRWIQARGDMAVYNEPSQYAFILHMTGGTLPAEYNHNNPFKTFADVKKVILKAREEGMVFVKDPTCAAYTSFYNDSNFLADPNIEFCFIVRDLHAALVSYYKGIGLRRRPPTGFAWNIERGIYERHWALFEKIKQVRNKAPLVISCEDLAEHPEKILPLFCEHMGISFDASMLTWPSLADSFDPLTWHDYKTADAIIKWHKDAINSTHFIPCVRQHAVDEQGNPSFTEFDPKYAQALRDVYEYSLPFYTKMYAHRLTP
jgi:hypothetical protein